MDLVGHDCPFRFVVVVVVVVLRVCVCVSARYQRVLATARENKSDYNDDDDDYNDDDDDNDDDDGECTYPIMCCRRMM